jgi:hypothetical protein
VTLRPQNLGSHPASFDTRPTVWCMVQIIFLISAITSFLLSFSILLRPLSRMLSIYISPLRRSTTFHAHTNTNLQSLLFRKWRSPTHSSVSVTRTHKMHFSTSIYFSNNPVHFHIHTVLLHLDTIKVFSFTN